MACRYPDASSPRELWENALAGRRAFRRLPDVRMNLSDYWDADPAAPDRFYARNAAVIEGYEFDRIAYKVAGSTFRSTDLTHWLALDVAAQALADAGFPMAEGLPRERTGVVVGNTLTGEFSRANQLRLRWPFVRRMVVAALKEQDWDDEQLGAFLDRFEETFKSPFPPIDEDTLAGGLSNTIAGRICNHFDLKGGGYTVDGACSSSLLSVATACKALIDGEIDVAVAGGVDLSLDPFELIGFAKTAALATGEMRVYDRRSNGFWPGEGCGMVVLMREAEARPAGHRIYASIAGWGISSDGRGGITRPEVGGYRLALRRAYERAGFGIDTVALFEGHGTGTAVGDATELTALTEARAAAGPAAPPAAIGSIKAMIGHTKAAAGVAGLIKAAMAVHHQVLPPTVGCVEPHELLAGEPAVLRVLRKAEAWPAAAPVRAGVTAMGFGGINTHVVLEHTGPRRRITFDMRTRALAASVQDAELLLVGAASADELRERIGQLIQFVPTLAYAQLADLAATLHRHLRDHPYRAAVVVTGPEDAHQRLQNVRDALDAGEASLFAADGRVFLGHARGPGRIGLLFPGQGSGRGTTGGALRRRFADVEEIYLAAALPTGGDLVATAIAQPRIAAGSLAGLRALSLLGLEATVAVGHSLGELAALHWAGAMDEATLLRLAGVRGRTMAEHSASGTMASVAAPADTVTRLVSGLPVVIAGYNGPQQTVIAGTVDAVEAACRLAADAGVPTDRLAVSHAFHSQLVAPAADAFAGALRDTGFDSLDRRVVSTVTGAALPAETDVVALLRRQITDPVLFGQALALAAKEVDLFVEVGPGRVLTGLAAVAVEVPAVALDTDDESLAGLLRVAAAAHVVGVPAGYEPLFQARLTRPLELDAEFSFFASPCEQGPPLTVRGGVGRPVRTARPPVAAPAPVADAEETDPLPETARPHALDLLRRLAAARAELPLAMVRPESRLLDELHLSSITVGQVVSQVAQHLGIPLAQSPVNFAVATIGELAATLESLAPTGRGAEPDAPVAPVAGAAAWVRAWAVDLAALARPTSLTPEPNGTWRVYSTGESPIAEPLRRALESARVGAGVLVCLPPECTVAQVELALTGARAAIAAPAGTRFVVVQHGRGAAGLAKTLRLEAPQLRISVVHVPVTAEAVGWVVAEVAGTATFTEAYYDEAGARRVPTLRALPVRPARTDQPLDATDVLLVTGGGKGITAECARALAAESGAKLAVLGRSDPGLDQELAANLARFEDAGVTVRYARADVTDADQVRRAVAELTGALGPITAVLHGAGRNEPAALTSLDLTAFRRTFAPKIDGLNAVLAAVEPDRLRMLVTFGSIIGRAGLQGEAHYATANEWLAGLTEQFAERFPNCRTRCLEWSVWSGVGMGERLSVIESLTREGITPISPDQGVLLLHRIVTDPDAPTVTVISGRAEGIDTIRYHEPSLPLLRFLARPLIRYHDVELVTEVELNPGTDRYLGDHRLDGNLLFPAVFGLEAMAQVATAVTGRGTVPVIERAEFPRPIVVPPLGSTTIQVAAVVTDNDTVDVVIRSEETAYAAEHFRARLRFTDRPAPAGPPEPGTDELPPVPLDPARDLYGTVLFQGERFQRLRRYHRAAAREVDADLAVEERVPWFADFLPSDLLLGDPGVRDALMHGNQVCVPHATLLPVGIERLYPSGRLAAGELRYCATERHRDGDLYVYDVALRTPTGELVERWQGLHLRAVRKADGRGPWPAPLLGPYLERMVEDLLGVRIAVAVEPDAPSGDDDIAARRRRTALAVGRALGRPATVHYRPDGRPELHSGADATEPNGAGLGISASHGGGLTLCVSGTGALGCDLQPVAARPAQVWQGLLGSHAELAQLVAAATGEDADTGATRVWAAIECLQKAGRSPADPLALRLEPEGGWVVFGSGDTGIATLATTVRGLAPPVVIALLAEGQR
jgi:enediyne polyketide synthase